MADPQSDFFVRFSKELFDAILHAHMPASHLLVILTAVRLTDGDRGRREAPISIGMLTRATGLSRSCVKEALGDLLREGVIVEIQPPSYGHARIVALNKDYETWGRFTVKLDDIPEFLAHDWQTEQYRQPAQGGRAAQGGEAAQGGQAARNCTDQPHTPGPAGRTKLYRQAAPTKEETHKTERSSSAKPGRQTVAAPTETDWRGRADQLLQRTAFRSEFEHLAEIMAAENTSGKVSLSRVVRQLYEPLVELEQQVSREAMRRGLRAAVTKGVANANYVAKAACSHNRSPALAKGHGQRPLPASDHEFFTEHFDQEDR